MGLNVTRKMMGERVSPWNTPRLTLNSGDDHCLVLITSSTLNVVLKMASQGATPESFILENVVRGGHIYKQTWTPF